MLIQKIKTNLIIIVTHGILCGAICIKLKILEVEYFLILYLRQYGCGLTIVSQT